jgi:hypothetical protein
MTPVFNLARASKRLKGGSVRYNAQTGDAYTPAQANTYYAEEYEGLGSIVEGRYTIGQAGLAATGVVLPNVIISGTVEVDWPVNLFRELSRLSQLSDDWNSDGAEAPNNVALYWANEVLRESVRGNYRPHRIVPSAEGGIAITFRSGQKYADIECFNSSEILAITSDGETEPEAWVVNPDNILFTLEKIHDFITSERSARAYVQAGSSY